MSEIDFVFNSLIRDVEDFANGVAQTFLHESTKAVAELWANEIIDMIISQRLSPPLSEKTIKRRRSRKISILGPDYPLLETGEWITYIEFRINQFNDHDELEVGVFDESTPIGHTDKSPVYIAALSEYGKEDLIPARTPFASSELKIESKIDTIIRKAWDKVPAKVKSNTFSNTENLVGRIVSNGSEFLFRWDS